MTSQARHVRLLRGWRRKTLAVVAALIVVFAAATARVLIWPVEWTPAKADAIVMLAGPGDRLPVALQLAAEHRAPVLVVSRGWMGYGGPCPPPTPGVRTICFDPNPGNTRGEAEYVGALARRNAWHSLIVVAIRPQAVRAQLLFEQVLRRPGVRGHGPAAPGQLALPDRLRLGGAREGGPGGPGLLTKR